MLIEKAFKNGLMELENVFDGFNLTESKVKTWYKYSKDMENSMWQKKIANCIKGCRKIPTLADILDIKGYYLDNSKEYQNFEPTEEIMSDPCPPEVKAKISKLINKIKMPIK